MKKLFLVFFLLSIGCFAQPDFNVNREAIQSGKFYNSEIHYFPSDSGYTVFYLYKISYSQLFFEKNSDHFIAGINVNVEVLDSSGNVEERNFDRREVAVKDFEQTNSEVLFVNGLIKFHLKKGKYSFLTIISDLISKRIRTLPPTNLLINDENLFLHPIVISRSPIFCAGIESYSLQNNSMTIPFNQPMNSLLIPVMQNEIKKINYSIIVSDSLLIKDKEIEKYIYLDNNISICDNNVVLSKSENIDSLKYFVMENFASNLPEVPIQIEITANDQINIPKQKFNLDVLWIHKPKSMMDIEQAIKFLEIIEPKEKVSELLGYKDLRKALFGYWKEKDPTPETTYNELMNEFYSRVDYCELKFKPINGNSGSKTDRGRIYIKFGNPDSIERDSNVDDKVVETWFYKKLKRSFIFIDYEGTGKFQLVSEQ